MRQSIILHNFKVTNCSYLRLVFIALGKKQFFILFVLLLMLLNLLPEDRVEVAMDDHFCSRQAPGVGDAVQGGQRIAN